MTNTTPQTPPRPVLLCIMDGWGHREDVTANAVALGKTPNVDRLWQECPHGYMNASERFVGLPDGQMGNSEVGHMNLGAGRVVMQELPRIDTAIESGEMPDLEAVKLTIARLKETGGTCHLMGLVSTGGVHSHQRHIAALAKVLADGGIDVVVHVFTDGRDCPPRSAASQMQDFVTAMDGAARIASVTGRFYAMDRDKRWERVEAAWRAIVLAEADQALENPVAAIEAAYIRDETDEFITPTLVGGGAPIKDGDGIVMANFRADRAREILTALIDPEFDGFARPSSPELAVATGMVEYSSALAPMMETIFPPTDLIDTLGEVTAAAGKTQLRIAETEKYRGGDQGGRDRGYLRRRRCGCDHAGRWRHVPDRRSRQLRDHGRSRYARSAYRAHHESGAHDAARCTGQPNPGTARTPDRQAGRRRTNPPGPHGGRTTEGDDRRAAVSRCR